MSLPVALGVAAAALAVVESLTRGPLQRELGWTREQLDHAAEVVTEWMDDEEEGGTYRQLGERVGMPYLDVGSTRIVFALGDRHVFKVEAPEDPMLARSWLGSMKANEVEAEIWQRATRAERRNLAPVVAMGADGDWLIMERLIPVSHLPAERAARLHMRRGWSRGILRHATDLTDHNLGLRPGETALRALDYVEDKVLRQMRKRRPRGHPRAPAG